MPRKAPKYKQPPPAGYVYIDKASELSGRTIETLYKDRSVQRRTGHCNGPRSRTLNGKAVWSIAEIKAWLDQAPELLGPTAEDLNDSRPPESARVAA